MKVNKIIKTTEEIDIDIEGITLLSIEEYEQFRDEIPPVDVCWWLRSPGWGGIRAALINNFGMIYYTGDFVNSEYVAVRPVLIINNNFQVKDEFEFGNHIWTVISVTYAICNDCIGFYCFRNDIYAENDDDYNESDIKKYIEKWLEDMSN